MASTIPVPCELENPRITTLAGNVYWSINALTAYDQGRWVFTKDVDGKLYGKVRVPKNLAGTPNGKIVLVTEYNATSGVSRWSVSTKAVADGASLNPASLVAETSQDITVPATARLRKDITYTLTNVPAADEILILEIFHEGAHANDTLSTADSELLGAYLLVDLA